MRVRSIAGVLLALAAFAAPTHSLAQRRRRGRGRGNNAQPANPPPDNGGGGGDTSAPAGGGGAAGGDGGGMTFTDDPNANGNTDAGAATPPPAGGDTGTGGAAAGTGSGLEGIGGPDVTAQSHPLREQIWAVQQIYALRRGRLEVQPTVGISLNDPYVSHTGVGIGVNYWVTNVLAAGVNFMWFGGLNGRSDVDFHVARSARVVVPINEYQLEAALNFSYVPVYGKFLMFNQYIFHWDIYVLAGIGLQRTRPIAVVDPEVRTFDWQNSIMFNAALGVRVFVNRWLGVVGEIRNYIYDETLEATTINPRDQPVTNTTGMQVSTMCDTPGGPMCNTRQDPATWTGEHRLTDNVMVQIGITVFLPFDVSYRLLK